MVVSPDWPVSRAPATTGIGTLSSESPMRRVKKGTSMFPLMPLSSAVMPT
jgi:hypothetical protein